MSNYKTFAIAGAGLIGRPIIDALLAHKATVIALTRSQKDDALPDGGKYAVIDYDDVPGIAKVLKENHVDVLISALAREGLKQQINLADASKEAGVRLFVPSEFGVPTVGRTDGLFGAKANLIDHLENLGVPSFRVFTGIFIEAIFQVVGYDSNKKVNIVGKGTAPVSFTAIADIAGYFGHVLTTHPPETIENKIVRLEGDRATLLEIAAYLKADVAHVDDVPGPMGPVVTSLQHLLDTGAGSTGWDNFINAEGSEKAGSGNALWEGHVWKRISDILKV